MISSTSQVDIQHNNFIQILNMSIIAYFIHLLQWLDIILFRSSHLSKKDDKDVRNYQIQVGKFVK
jgi:hypothetical protein